MTSKTPTPAKPKKPRASTRKKTVGTSVNGGQTRYTPQVARAVLLQLSMGRSLSSICKQDGMPGTVAVHSWVVDDKDGFADRYKDARRVGYLLKADEVMDIGDDGSNDWMERTNPDNPGWQINGEAIARSRLRCDNIKWMLPKVLPDEFGDKTSIDLTIKDESRTDDELVIELMKLRAVTGSAAPSRRTKVGPKRLN